MAMTFSSWLGNRPERDDDREERIQMEIVVDAYDGAEQAAGWHAYLSDHLAFPFEARCTETRTDSPLRPGDRIVVTAMDADSEFDMRVVTAWGGREFSVPLAQLEPAAADETATAAADWRYWQARGYTFF